MPFFSNYLGVDFPLTIELLDMYDEFQYYFITNFLSYQFITDLQLMLRFSIKLDVGYTDLITPVEFVMWQEKMEKIEEARKKDREKN
jgi:hypothetical protein